MKYVHIAGTNGKGSAAEYIYQIILAAGKSCGCFTSPHLLSPTERFRANGQTIESASLEALLSEVKQKKLAVNDTMFAAYTAAALLWFERLGLDFAVFETGLGGRLDPTNVITPEVSVLTTIGYDHTDVLGDTIEEIALEKAGIIKPGIPVVSVKQCLEAETVIRTEAEKKGARVYFLSPIEVLSSSLDGQTFQFGSMRYKIQSIGGMQPELAALAAFSTRLLGLGDAAVSKGLMHTLIPCRTQYIPGAPAMLLDGAHNTASVQALCKTLDTHFSGDRKVLLFACMKDKDISAIAAHLSPYFHTAVFTSVDSLRGASIADLNTHFSHHISCKAFDDPANAFDHASSIAVRKQSLLVICGSFYLSGMIWGLLTQKQ